MNARNRPANRRIPSGAWSRLKAGTSDPLENVGLPSKGDTRLHEFKAQEAYYNHITERYVKFCAAAGTRDELEKHFASLSLVSTSENTVPQASSQHDGAQKTQSKVDVSPSSSPELATILMAMRKLREAIIATSRHDNFAQRVYVFIIRATILVKHMESYHPALLYLLHQIHPRTPLPPPELQEFVGYYLLDLACRQGDYVAAYAARYHYDYRDRRVESVLSALVHDNWIQFWRTRRAVDGHQRRLMEWAEDRLRLHTLKSMARTYFTVEKQYVEKCAEMPWNNLVTTLQVGWQLDGEQVIIRRPKAK